MTRSSIGIGVGLGVCLGAAFGSALHNVGLGVAFGICLGVVFSIAFGRGTSDAPAPKSPAADKPVPPPLNL